MPAGLTVYMDDGILQIDSSQTSSSLVYKTTYSGPYYNDGNTAFIGTWYNFTINVPSNVKYLFFSSTVDRSIALFKKEGTTHTFRTTAQGSFDIYGFSDTVTTNPGRSGLQLFDENGNLTFDSESKYLRIADAFIAKPPDPLWETGGVTKPWPSTTKKYAAGIGFYAKRWRGAQMGGIPWGVQISYAIKVGPTSVTGGEAAIGSRPWGGGGAAPPNDTPRHAPPTVLVVDVTNF